MGLWLCSLSIQNFELLWNHPKNRRWRRCCMTGTCCMRQSHSTHCNSCGYDLISLAVVLWHHTAALRCRAAAVRCHTAAVRCHTAAMRQPQDVAEALRLSHCLVARALWLLHSCASDWELLTQKKGIMCKPTTQNNPWSWLCAFGNCTYFVMLVAKLNSRENLLL